MIVGRLELPVVDLPGLNYLFQTIMPDDAVSKTECPGVAEIRTLSLTQVTQEIKVSKCNLFEKLTQQQLCPLFQEHLSQYLCVYRKGYTTQYALLKLTESCKEVLDKNGYSAAAIDDLSKAFDTIKHDLSMAKLFAYGIRGSSLKLLKDYLNNRF